ncbi:unnamed protein product, partial [Symbiodinium sp. CCMP2456]
MTGPSEMPYVVRKRYYSKANRLVRARDVDPAIVRKYDMLRTDADRFSFMKELLLAPSMAQIKIEDHYRSVVRDSHKDKYRTVTLFQLQKWFPGEEGEAFIQDLIQ